MSHVPLSPSIHLPHEHHTHDVTAVAPLHRLWLVLAASPSLLMALLIAKLWLTGTLQYYVNSRTVWTVLLGGVFFAAIGILSVGRAWRGHGGVPTWRTALFLLPVLLGLLLPARPLSAASGQASSLGAMQLASHVSSGAPGDRFGYWVNELTAHPDPSWWAGQHVVLVGFVANEAGLQSRSFIIGRYVVTCCVVDAMLLGFPVHIAHGPIPAAGAWVQVSGVFGSRYWTDPTGSHYPIIKAARISRVTIPSSPYLSP